MYNKVQSPHSLIEEIDDKAVGKEIRAEVIEALNSIQFLKNLVSPTRRYVKDMEKDENGKIIVDITNPHILENMDYFRGPAKFYEDHRTYTRLVRNGHPLSAYAQYWKEERRKCLEGVVREDGEWIPGDYYWYLNYSPIMVTRVNEKTKKASRVEAFPDIYDGDYLYYHYKDKARARGKHGSVLKKRGAGFSFKGGSKLARAFILGDTMEAYKGVRSFAMANEKEYLTKDGVLNKFVDIIDHNSDHTEFPRIRDKDSWNDMHWTMGYKDKDTGVQRGTRNQVMGVTLKNDPDKARGKRGALIIWEEMGKFPNILKAWQVARPSVEEGEYAFGTMIAYGTGGTDDADFSGAEELFYYPEGYNILSIPNVFDKNVQDTTCGFFFPEYINKKGYYDENGNSDVVGALISIMRERINIKYHSSDPNALVQEMAERPITPQEAILRKEGSMFPVMDIKDYLSEILPQKERFVAPHYVGHLAVGSDGKVKWSADDSLTPLREYPHKKGGNIEGAIEIFEMPQKGQDGTIPQWRYIAGIDPVDDDHSTTNSLPSIFIFDTFTDRIVAEYTGRPATANAFYEVCRRMLIYYNAIANYENDKKGLYGYFYNNNALHLLCDTPQILKDQNMVKGPAYGNKAKGTNSSSRINQWARRLQRDWMIQVAYGEDTEDEEVDVIKLNLHKIRSIAYLEEARQWNMDGNFDRISAMGMCMILRENLLKRIDSVKSNDTTPTLANDPFFKNNYSMIKNRYKIHENNL